MKRCLIILTGIGEHAYGLRDIKNNPKICKHLFNKYGEENIFDLDYQDIMDGHAIAFKTILDPVRVLTPDGKKAQIYIQKLLEYYCKVYESVDVLSHSLGSWLILKCNSKINNLYSFACPRGWRLPLGRLFVEFNIKTPKLKVNNYYYFYSENDFISCKLPNLEGKWLLEAKHKEVWNTQTSHSLEEYLRYAYVKTDIFSI